LFHEQVSSVASRPEFERALQFVRKGDTLVVTKVDRLARSMRDLSEIVDTLRAKGAHLKVLGTDIDTASATGSLLLNLLGSFARVGAQQRHPSLETPFFLRTYHGGVRSSCRQRVNSSCRRTDQPPRTGASVQSQLQRGRGLKFASCFGGR
jgi:hypothetical protein